MLYELRVYEIVPGKMPDINNRFANTTLRIFDRHGIRVVGFWTDLFGITNRLIYMLAWESLAEREQKWNAFQSDQEWATARAKSEEAGPIVSRVINTIMQPTPYSPMQ